MTSQTTAIERMVDDLWMRAASARHLESEAGPALERLAKICLELRAQGVDIATISSDLLVLTAATVALGCTVHDNGSPMTDEQRARVLAEVGQQFNELMVAAVVDGLDFQQGGGTERGAA